MKYRFFACICLAWLLSFKCASAAEGWTLDVKKNPIDDTTTASAYLFSNEEVAAWPKNTKPMLIVRCQSNRTEVFMDAGTNFDVEYANSDFAHVVIRLDKQKAFTVNASQSTDGHAIFIPKPVSFVKKLLTSSVVLIGFTPFNSSPVVATFNVQDNRAALNEVKKTCNW